MNVTIAYQGDHEKVIWQAPIRIQDTDITVLSSKGKIILVYSNNQIIACFNDHFKEYLIESPRGLFNRKRDIAIYYMDVLTHYDLNWGTNPAIEIEDKNLHIKTKVKAFGTYKIKLKKSLKPLIRLDLMKEEQDIFLVNLKMKNEIITTFKTVLNQLVNDEKSLEYMINKPDNEVALISLIKQPLKERLDNFGVDLIEFNIIKLTFEHEVIDETSKSSNMSCPYCSIEVDKSMAFCPSCGKRLKEDLDDI
jgi:membrane protease subunit (stomatin/prohibitin family)